MTTTKKPSKRNLFWKMILSQTINFIRETPISWIFGFLLSLPTLGIVTLESISLQSQGGDPFLLAPRIIGIFLLIVFLFFVSEAGLILSLKKTSYSLLEHIASTGALIRWYFLFLIILTGFFALFFSPFIVAPPETQSVLKYISIIFFLLIVSILFILKMFGGFYLILSRLSLRNAFHASATLFTNHAFQSGILLVATSILSMLFSLIITSLHNFFTFPFSDKFLFNTTTLLCIMTLSSFFHIFLRIFWYFFFQAIAGEKPKGWQTEKKMVEESMVPAEDEA